MHQIEGPSVTIFLQKGGGSFDSLGDESKKGVIWQFNTFLILLENFDRKSNKWGSLGVRSYKKREAFSKEKKMQKRGSTVRRMAYTGQWECVPLPPAPPPQLLT